MTLGTTMRDDHTLATTHRAVWALGDYALMAEQVMAPLGPILVATTGIGPGMRVLDVAAGSGNISLSAARPAQLSRALVLDAEVADQSDGVAVGVRER
jgi:2-polyprenyl-3-methyl-5-hydroxy-6-metoxy-1,4-benzoquinol methylase